MIDNTLMPLAGRRRGIRNTSGFCRNPRGYTGSPNVGHGLAGTATVTVAGRSWRCCQANQAV